MVNSLFYNKTVAWEALSGAVASGGRKIANFCCGAPSTLADLRPKIADIAQKELPQKAVKIGPVAPPLTKSDRPKRLYVRHKIEPLTAKDFQPVNTWRPCTEGPCWVPRSEPKFIEDSSTARKYLNESRATVRTKCALLVLGTPFVHSIGTIAELAFSIFKVGVAFGTWIVSAGRSKCDFKAELIDAGKNLLRVVAIPFVIIALEMAAIYGILSPYDGRKLYASIERVVYGDYLLAPCFQPNPVRHAFGGDINQQNAY